MEVITKTFATKNGPVEGVQVKWAGFSILLVTGTKGFLACGVFDVAAIDSFGSAAALVESTPANPIGTLERFPNRSVVKVNAKARSLGITEGMAVPEAFEKIA
ncbi:MAG: DUF1805 domain-containing protein [Candidatus Omnitrophica bacterium]|nr:DUF1805 domain-containing protein [Candidatus Omnitrophota bacterium]